MSTHYKYFWTIYDRASGKKLDSGVQVAQSSQYVEDNCIAPSLESMRMERAKVLVTIQKEMREYRDPVKW